MTARAQDVPVEGEQLSLENLLDIVVTATLREQSTLDAPASIQVVSAADIRARGYRTIKQIMNDVPGFNDVSDANEEIAAVRGVWASTTNKILVLVNGHRMNDLMLGRYNLDQFLGVDVIERVEFIRGPASALYGTGALVGLVNIITKKGSDINGTQLRGQGGIYGQEASATWGKKLVGYDVLFNFTYLNALGQELAQDADLDVVRPGQTKEPGEVYLGRYRENMSGYFNLRGDNSSLQLRAAHFRRATPRGSNGSLYDYTDEPWKPAYTENDFFADYQYNWVFGADGKNKLTINPSIHYFGYYEHSFVTFGANRMPPLGSRSGTAGEYNQYQLKVTYDRQVLDSLNVIAGLDGLASSFYRSDLWLIRNPAAGGQYVELIPNGYTEPGKWFLGGAFLQTVFSPVKQLQLTLGARFDTFQGVVDPELTPRAGLVYKPFDQLTFKALYGRSFLAPMWSHARTKDPNFLGTAAAQAIGQNLDGLGPEKFEGFDFIVGWGDRRASATLDLFYNKVEGLINGVPITGMAGRSYYDNSGDTLYMGAELAAEGQVLPWLRLSGSWSYIRADKDTNRTTARFLDPDGKILQVAPHTLRYGVKLDPIQNLTVSAWGRAYTATPTQDNVREPATMENMGSFTEIPAVAIFDLGVTYDWRFLTAQLFAYNLTNRKYERGGATSRPLPRMGLNVEASLAAKF